MFLTVEKQFNNGKPILFGQNTFKAPFSIRMNETDVLTDSAGKRYVTEGMFIVNAYTTSNEGNDIRFLPRTRLNAATATDSALVQLKAPSFTFKVSDVLYAQACYAEVVITGNATAADVFTLRVGMSNYSVTAAGADTPAETAAAFVTDHAAALLTEGVTIAQKGTSGVLTLFSTDSHKLNAYVSGSGTSTMQVVTTDPGYFGDMLTPLGTISSIAFPDADGMRVVTLSGNAAYVVPEGCSVGVLVEKHLGIYPEPLDFTNQPSIHLAPYRAADGVYETNLPYIDKQLKRIHSELNINKKFYRTV